LRLLRHDPTGNPEMRLLVGLARTEVHFELLGNYLDWLLGRIEEIYIPIPRSLCEKLVLGSLGGRVRVELNPALARVWSGITSRISKWVRLFPHVNLNCYYEDEDVRSMEEFAINISRLVLRYRIGRVNVDDWLSILPKHTPSLPEAEVVVTDDYNLLIKHIGFVDHVVLGPLVPTPIELLIAMANSMNIDIIQGVVQEVVRYIDYIIESTTLTQAYSKLLNPEYVGLVRRLGLLVIA